MKRPLSAMRGLPVLAQDGLAGTLAELPAIAVELAVPEITLLGSRSDLSLRSARSLLGYRIEARDGAAGRWEDVLVDDGGWSIEAFVAHSPRLFSGSRYLAPAHAVSAIDSVHRALRLNLTRAQIAAGTTPGIPFMTGPWILAQTSKRPSSPTSS